MAYTITSQCIECDRCLSVCPTQAIQKNESHYWIDPNRCNNCVGQYSVPQCWASCPTNVACVPFMSGTTAVVSQPAQESAQPADYWETWFSTYERLVTRLQQAKQSTYWQRWFDAYSTVLAKQLQTPTATGLRETTAV